MNANLIEMGHPVLMLVPIDANAAAQTSNCVNTKLGDRLNIIGQIGTHGAAMTVTVEECTDAAGAGNTAIAFDYYLSSGRDGSTFGARTAATAAGFATTTASSMFLIDIKGDQLSATKPYVRVLITDPGAAAITSVVGIITPLRYASLAANQPDATA